MHQQHVTHPVGTFPCCGSCRREPMHIECVGRTSCEDATPLSAPLVRHQLECNRCGRRTSRHASLGAARAEWAVSFALRPDSTAQIETRRTPALTTVRSLHA